MSVAVTSAADVRPGDLVEFAPYNNFRQAPPVVCTVVKAGKSSLTFTAPNGTTQRKSFTTAYTSRSFGRGPTRRGPTRHVHHNFRRLDARDRWMREIPRGLNITADAYRGFVSIVLTADDVRDHVTTSNHLALLADWLAKEPARGAP